MTARYFALRRPAKALDAYSRFPPWAARFSSSMIRIACFRLVTFGPCLEPECRTPRLNFDMTSVYGMLLSVGTGAERCPRGDSACHRATHRVYRNCPTSPCRTRIRGIRIGIRDVRPLVPKDPLLIAVLAIDHMAMGAVLNPSVRTNARMVVIMGHCLRTLSACRQPYRQGL